MRTHNGNYEEAPEFTGDAYTVDGWGSGIAWVVLGWQTVADDDTEWTGYEVRNGRLVVRMIGDDRNFDVDPECVHEIPEDSYCHSCGQIGCGHNIPEVV